MTDFGDLAFHVRYGIEETVCDHEVPCGAVHRRRTGEATLTLAGPEQLIREAAALVFPDLAKVFNPPMAEPKVKAIEQPVQVEYCPWCPYPSAPSLRYHPDGKAHHREQTPDIEPPTPSGQESAYLSYADLAAMYVGATVTALGLSAEDRRNGDRCRWKKAPNEYWFPSNGARGISSRALAKYHQPTLDNSSDDA